MAMALDVGHESLDEFADDTMCAHDCLLPCRMHAHICICAHVYKYLTPTPVDEFTCASIHMLAHMWTCGLRVGSPLSYLVSP